MFFQKKENLTYFNLWEGEYLFFSIKLNIKVFPNNNLFIFLQRKLNLILFYAFLPTKKQKE